MEPLRRRTGLTLCQSGLCFQTSPRLRDKEPGTDLPPHPTFLLLAHRGQSQPLSAEVGHVLGGTLTLGRCHQCGGDKKRSWVVPDERGGLCLLGPSGQPRLPGMLMGSLRMLSGDPPPRRRLQVWGGLIGMAPFGGDEGCLGCPPGIWDGQAALAALGVWVKWAKSSNPLGHGSGWTQEAPVLVPSWGGKPLGTPKAI